MGYPKEVCVELERAFHEVAVPKAVKDSCSQAEQADSIPAQDSDGRVASTSDISKNSGTTGAASLQDALHRLQGGVPESIAPEEAHNMRDLALSINADPRAAFLTLRILVQRENVLCTLDDVRRAGLLVGSMAMLKLVLASNSK